MNAKEKRYAALADSQGRIKRELGGMEWTRNEAVDAVAEGTATLDQFALVGRSLVRQGLKRWGPTLTLGRARRHLDLPVGYRRPEAWLLYLPGDVLSHHPGEQLSDDLKVKVEQMDGLWNCNSSDPVDRAAAALARLTMGPGLGESRRHYFWSGRCDKLANKRTVCTRCGGTRACSTSGPSCTASSPPRPRTLVARPSRTTTTLWCRTRP